MTDMTNDFYSQKLDILWEPAGDGARVLRVYGEQPVLSLPESIDGRPVTEIGPYCFSRSEPKLPETYFHHYTDSQNTEQLSSLSGNVLEMVRLPDTVTTLHNAAFYNCRSLHTLSVSTGIRSIGSDEFMNCTSLRRLVMRCTDTEAEGLPLLLERFADDLLVQFIPETHPANDWEPPTASAALFFPEYYEWLDEISPAHIFSRSIHGEGFRMRKCFENGRIHYEKYDLCFENARKVESDETLCRIAITRLRWPNGLKEDMRRQYETALTERLFTAVNLAVKSRDLELLLFLCSFFSTGDYTQAIVSCVEADWGEGSARLMEEKHQSGSFAEKEFSFDDF